MRCRANRNSDKTGSIWIFQVDQGDKRRGSSASTGIQISTTESSNRGGANTKRDPRRRHGAASNRRDRAQTRPAEYLTNTSPTSSDRRGVDRTGRPTYRTDARAPNATESLNSGTHSCKAPSQVPANAPSELH